MYELPPVEQKLTHDSTVIAVELAYEAAESVRLPTLSLSKDVVSDVQQQHWATYVQHPYDVQPAGRARRWTWWRRVGPNDGEGSIRGIKDENSEKRRTTAMLIGCRAVRSMLTGCFIDYTSATFNPAPCSPWVLRNAQ